MGNRPSRTNYLRIGQVAARTGVTAKSLRLYELRGLLQPDAFSRDGKRLYAAPALARLHEICVLKRAGFALDDIGPLLAGHGVAAAMVATRIVALRSELGVMSQALATLQNAWQSLGSAPTDIEKLLSSIKMSKVLEMNFASGDLDAFARRSEVLLPTVTVDACDSTSDP